MKLSKKNIAILQGKGVDMTNMSISGSLDLRRTAITALPNNLYVGRHLHLEGTAIVNYPVVYNCGFKKRAIYLSLKDKNLIVIGCFEGTKKEAINRIKNEYPEKEASAYIKKVEECFKKLKK